MRRTLPVLLAFMLSQFSSPFLYAEVFHLSDGSVKVGSAPSSMDRPFIKIKTLCGVETVATERVIRVEAKKAALKKYKEYRAHLDREDPRALTTLATFCRQNGLFKEMFTLYDQLIVLDPDNPHWHELVDDLSRKICYESISAEIPQNLQSGFTLLKKSAHSGITLGRIGEQILSALPSDIFNAVIWKGLGSSSDKAQAMAIEITVRRRLTSMIEPLIGVAIFERNHSVRAAAQDALTHFDHDGIIYPFLRALRSNVRSHRYNALAALAKLGDIRTAGALISRLGNTTTRPGSHRAHVYSGKITSAVTGFEPEIATSAAIANPKVSLIQDGALLDVNVLGVSSRSSMGKEERKRLAATLKAVTGVDYGEDLLLWREWWINNRSRILDR